LPFGSTSWKGGCDTGKVERRESTSGAEFDERGDGRKGGGECTKLLRFDREGVERVDDEAKENIESNAFMEDVPVIGVHGELSIEVVLAVD